MTSGSGSASFEDAEAALEQALEELEANVPNYNEWLRSLLAPAAQGRVLELGAGVGTFSAALLQTADHVVAVEPSTVQGAMLLEAARSNRGVTAIVGYIGDAIPHGPFDGAVLSNVLEHIEHDEATLRELRSLVKPTGLVAVFSPAFQLLMSDFDRSIGHFHRYRKRGLVAKFERAGFEVVEARYVNMPGFFAWLLIARILKQRPTGSKLSKLYDRSVVPVARWIESRIEPPFGQSVLVIGRVPATTSATPTATPTATSSTTAAESVVDGG